MELNQHTEQDVQALAEVTGQKKSEIVEQAVEQYMEETGKQLIRQQAQQTTANQQDIETEE